MLHIVNKSPFSSQALDSCVQVSTGGDLLLIEDGVYAASSGTVADNFMRDILKRFRVFALGPDLEARGLADRLIDGITPVDYAGFVDLVARNKTCQSWL